MTGFAIVPAENDGDTEWINARLVAANARLAPDENYRPLVLVLRDAQGRRRGGVIAFTSWDWLVIESLVVDEGHRGDGHGRRLVASVEALARSLGCRRARLETFQAEAFYASLGYQVSGRSPDYPPGHSWVTMTKTLSHDPQ